MELSGCVALVTGGNRGIGACLVRELVARGARHVYAAARDPETVGFDGAGRVSAVKLDITDPVEVAAAAEACQDVTLLINCAGISNYETALWPGDPEAARAEMEVNYFGTLSMCRAFAPVLVANGGGALANILSISAMRTSPYLASYGASKAAAGAITSGMRAQLRDHGTLVSRVYLGVADTEMAARAGGFKEKPEDIARAILDGIANGEEEILADARAREAYQALREDPKKVERSPRRAGGRTGSAVREPVIG
jgi:NAD(P)-dependent dehydrogenase (short-subunit alcohol dehydrogenase family)